MKSRQLALFEKTHAEKKVDHGGPQIQGKRKTRRPHDSRKAVHVVMRSTHSRGPWSMGRVANRLCIDRLKRQIAKKWGVKIYEFANSGNHLHILLKAPDRRSLQNFLRQFSGQVAMAMTHSRKGQSVATKIGVVARTAEGKTAGKPAAKILANGETKMERKSEAKTGNMNLRFWDALAYTRLVSWGREFINVQKYVFQNTLESLGVIKGRDAMARQVLKEWWAKSQAQSQAQNLIQKFSTS